MTAPSERRLAAILAADVVGYSRLMEADEKGTHERLRALRKELIEPPIGAHRGRIVKLTGDGALVEFPSVVDAVECAVAVQKAVAERNGGLPEQQQLWLRLGINIGDIILEDGDIYGDGVNVASRLEGLAEPGGICVSRNVYNQVKNKVGFGFEPMGEHRVKNIAEPITVYRVRPGPGRLPAVGGRQRYGGRALAGGGCGGAGTDRRGGGLASLLACRRPAPQRADTGRRGVGTGTRPASSGGAAVHEHQR